MQDKIATAVEAIQGLSLADIDARLDEIEQERFLLLAVRAFREKLECEPPPAVRIAQEPSNRKPPIESDEPFMGRETQYKLYSTMRVIDYWDLTAEVMSVRAIARELKIRSVSNLYAFFRSYSHYIAERNGNWSLTEAGRTKFAELKQIYEQPAKAI